MRGMQESLDEIDLASSSSPLSKTASSPYQSVSPIVDSEHKLILPAPTRILRKTFGKLKNDPSTRELYSKLYRELFKNVPKYDKNTVIHRYPLKHWYNMGDLNLNERVTLAQLANRQSSYYGKYELIELPIQDRTEDIRYVLIEYKYIDKPEEYTGPLDEDEEYHYGMFEGSEEEFNNTYYAPDLDEYGDEDTPYHPPWVTLEDLEYEPDAKYEPLPHTTTISEDISRQVEAKINKKIRNIKKLKLFTNENGRIKVDPEVLTKHNELEMILILLGKFKQPYEYKFESNHLLESYDKITKTIYKVKDKIISYKKDDVVISLSNMRKAYSKLLNSLTNIVVNNLRESIFHDINAYFDLSSFNHLFREYDYDEDWKLLQRTIIRYCLLNKYKEEPKTEEELNTEINNTLTHYNGLYVGIQWEYFETALFPYIKDVFIQPEIIALMTPRIATDERLKRLFTPVNPPTDVMTIATRHLILHNLPEGSQVRIKKILDQYNAIKKTYIKYEKMLRKAGFTNQYAFSSRQGEYLERIDDAYNLVIAKKYTFNKKNTLQEKLEKLKIIYEDMIKILSGVQTYTTWNGVERNKYIKEYENDKESYGAIIIVCNELAKLVDIHNMTEETTHIKNMIEKIYKLLPAYKIITETETIGAYTFYNNKFGYLQLLESMLRDSKTFINNLLEQKTNVITSISNHEFTLPVNPRNIKEFARMLEAGCHYIQTNKVLMFKTSNKRKKPSTGHSADNRENSKRTLVEQTLIPEFSNPIAHYTQQLAGLKDMIMILKQIYKLLNNIIKVQQQIFLGISNDNQLSINITNIQNLIRGFPSNDVFLSPYIENKRISIYSYQELTNVINHVRVMIIDIANVLIGSYRLTSFTYRTSNVPAVLAGPPPEMQLGGKKYKRRTSKQK